MTLRRLHPAPVTCATRTQLRCHGCVWPNRGVGGRDSLSDVNVLAVLQERNRINNWLTRKVTPWPSQRRGFVKNAASQRPVSLRKRGSKLAPARNILIAVCYPTLPFPVETTRCRHAACFAEVSLPAACT